MSCTDDIIEKYFRNCQIVFNEQKIDSSKGSFVWNCDETGFNGDRGKISILCRKGTRRPLKLTGNNEKINYTVHNCCNANGFFMPPFIVYKSAGRLYDNWMKGGPENAVYSTSPSGWMEKDQFSQWLEYVFVPETKKIVGNNHILLLDGHGSHVTLKSIEICIQNNVVLVCLPAHSSHILQPLDVGVYCHVKRTWKNILDEYYSANGQKNLDKENFAPLLKKLFDSNKCFTRAHAISGFQNTGFFPLNMNNINKDKLNIAQTFNIESLLTSSQSAQSPTQSPAQTSTQALAQSPAQTPAETPAQTLTNLRG
jgi:hypothetical protein